jgi:hypothetical protein
MIKLDRFAMEMMLLVVTEVVLCTVTWVYSGSLMPVYACLALGGGFAFIMIGGAYPVVMNRLLATLVICGIVWLMVTNMNDDSNIHSHEVCIDLRGNRVCGEEVP